MMKRAIIIVLLLLLTGTFSGCAYLVVGGAAAFGGYKLKEKGYKVQSPVSKNDQEKR